MRTKFRTDISLRVEAPDHGALNIDLEDLQLPSVEALKSLSGPRFGIPWDGKKDHRIEYPAQLLHGYDATSQALG